MKFHDRFGAKPEDRKIKVRRNERKNTKENTYVIFIDLLTRLLHVEPSVVRSINVPEHMRISGFIVIAFVALAR